MTNLYAVVGEHQDDSDRYLVLGADGSYYEWDLVTEQTVPVVPGEEWAIDPNLPDQPVQFEDVFIDP